MSEVLELLGIPIMHSCLGLVVDLYSVDDEVLPYLEGERPGTAELPQESCEKPRYGLHLLLA